VAYNDKITLQLSTLSDSIEFIESDNVDCIMCSVEPESIYTLDLLDDLGIDVVPALDCWQIVVPFELLMSIKSSILHSGIFLEIGEN